jgi:hypothetical protein
MQSQLQSNPDSSGIVESRGIFERSPLALAESLVTPGEEEGSNAKAKQHAELAGNGGPDTGQVSWEILLAVDGCGEDTTDTSGGNDDTGGNGTLGMAGDVVGALKKSG